MTSLAKPRTYRNFILMDTINATCFDLGITLAPETIDGLLTTEVFSSNAFSVFSGVLRNEIQLNADNMPLYILRNALVDAVRALAHLVDNFQPSSTNRASTSFVNIHYQKVVLTAKGCITEGYLSWLVYEALKDIAGSDEWFIHSLEIDWATAEITVYAAFANDLPREDG